MRRYILALKLTLINATGWIVILGGAWLVGRWAAAHTRREEERRNDIQT